ncbi:MFS transporter [Herbaspirillum sp.]|uniref:MFS transporter n=1 Tax=Herbaspirillum sp. TaxID=1890675 RepID=UPI0031D80595
MLDTVKDNLVQRTVSAGPRLDRLPISPFHHRILWLIGAGMFLDSFDIYLAGGVLGALSASGWSNMQQNANFLTATFIGMLIGAVMAGVLGDAHGRKFTYQFNLAVFGLASLAGAASPDMLWLIVCRFFMGLGLGAEIVVGYGTIGEFIPPAQRGKWCAYLSLITNSALFLSTLLGYLIIPHLGWRPMFTLVGIGALVIWVLRRNMPESPRWLESKGRDAEAEQTLSRLEAEAAARGVPLPPVEDQADSPVRNTPMSRLFMPPLLRRTVLGICVQVAINMVIYGFIVWTPTFLMKQGIGLSSSLGYSTLMSLGGPAGALIGVLVADRIGRKNGMIIVSALACVIGYLYSRSGSVEMATGLGFLLFTMTYLLVALGVATYLPELFPTESRMRGNGVCGAAGRLAGIFAPQIVVVVFAAGGIGNVLSVIVGALVLLVVALVTLGIETNQRTLEELDTTRSV